MSVYGIISVYRAVEYEYSAGSYKVLIDGVVAGTVRIGRTVELPVTPGSHQVRLAQGLVASLPLVLDVEPGGRHHLLARSNGSWPGSLRPKRALKLTTLSAPGA
ncbi:hypothetical protein P3T35_005463 [Kitasatospora sp. GP30]|uniref:hypothetical protein n=1 Tax=Kitasatospora sp. GP30 TaxID=3035084 RepID=UPI000C70D535|nr:hypothetical protein [Kitasatospora sp. GP30]MDH6143428.1 hypothetical protein [Kitasatospora sp. GP30]